MPDLSCNNPRDEDGHVTGGLVMGVGLAIQWQDGPITDHSTGQPNGALVPDVLQAALQRLQAYNDSPLRCRENSLAITKIEEALMWLEARQRDRTQRGVQGTYQP